MKGQLIVLTEAQLDRVKRLGAQTIEIRDFVPGPAIDFSYFESPYWLAPGRGGGKAYALLREALAK